MKKITVFLVLAMLLGLMSIPAGAAGECSRNAGRRRNNSARDGQPEDCGYCCVALRCICSRCSHYSGIKKQKEITNQKIEITNQSIIKIPGGSIGPPGIL